MFDAPVARAHIFSSMTTLVPPASYEVYGNLTAYISQRRQQCGCTMHSRDEAVLTKPAVMAVIVSIHSFS